MEQFPLISNPFHFQILWLGLESVEFPHLNIYMVFLDCLWRSLFLWLMHYGQSESIVLVRFLDRNV
jgi:hypothetical protein